MWYLTYSYIYIFAWKYDPYTFLTRTKCALLIMVRIGYKMIDSIMKKEFKSLILRTGLGGWNGADSLRSKVQLEVSSQWERSSGVQRKFSGAYHICIGTFLMSFQIKLLISKTSRFTKIHQSSIYITALGSKISKPVIHIRPFSHSFLEQEPQQEEQDEEQKL